jgi:hypothetical protein
MAIVQHSLLSYPRRGGFAEKNIAKLFLALPGKVDYFWFIFKKLGSAPYKKSDLFSTTLLNYNHILKL